ARAAQFNSISNTFRPSRTSTVNGEVFGLPYMRGIATYRCAASPLPGRNFSLGSPSFPPGPFLTAGRGDSVSIVTFAGPTGTSVAVNLPSLSSLAARAAPFSRWKVTTPPGRGNPLYRTVPETVPVFAGPLAPFVGGNSITSTLRTRSTVSYTVPVFGSFH